MTSNLGTTAWCAPELLTTTTKARYTVKVDVYSYGMVLWELWERKRPYEELYSRFDIIDAARAGRRPPIGTDCPAAYRSLIQRCWHDQPARRPTFAYIVRYLKDELAHIKRNRNSSVSAPFMQRASSSQKSHLTESKPKKPTPTAKGKWNFLAPIVGSGGGGSHDAPDSHPIPYVPPPVRLGSQPLTIPHKPTQESMDLLAASPWSDASDSMEHQQPSRVENTMPPYLFPQATQSQVSVDSSANEESSASTRDESTER
jgi:serine/threonine protein kinase